MSPLAKILIVVQALLVMSYLGVSSTLYQHRNDWRRSFISLKGRYTKTAKRASEEISSLRNTLKERNEFINLKEVEIGDLSKELKRAEADFTSKDQELARKTSEFDRLQQANTSLSTTNGTLNNTLESKRSSRDDLEARLNENIRRRQIAESQASRLQSETRRLVADLKGLNKNYSEVHDRLREKSLLIAMAEERGVNFATLLAGPPANLVRGRVAVVKSDMDPALVLVDIGEDSGVEIGYPLSVYRGKVFVGKLIVEHVESTASACRVLYVAEGQAMQPGDSVTTRLP